MDDAFAEEVEITDKPGYLELYATKSIFLKILIEIKKTPTNQLFVEESVYSMLKAIIDEDAD